MRHKEEEVKLLISTCNTSSQRELLFDLLTNFNYLTHDILSDGLNQISDYIVNDSNFSIETSQIAAITFDDEADSSQRFLDYIKVPLYKRAWYNVKTVNRYGAIMRNFKKGLTQIILIDEFVGSGKTIINRLKQLENDLQGKFDIRLCFLAGMDFAIKIIEKAGYKVFCPFRFRKGISEMYLTTFLRQAILDMKDMELKLASRINLKELNDYSFGYNQAEALYSGEGVNGNTPNSVFPIFWWPYCNLNRKRKTLLTRVERGLN